jgi:hypothetical protein
MLSTNKIRVACILGVIALTLLVKIGTADSAMLTPAQVTLYSNENTYQTRMNHWLDRLEQAESGGDIDMKYLDVNGKYSYGCLNFQEWTWDHYSHQFNVQGSIMSCSAQKEVATDMIASDYNLWRSWYTSVAVKHVGYPPTLSG